MTSHFFLSFLSLPLLFGIPGGEDGVPAKSDSEDDFRPVANICTSSRSIRCESVGQTDRLLTIGFASVLTVRNLVALCSLPRQQLPAYHHSRGEGLLNHLHSDIYYLKLLVSFFNVSEPEKKMFVSRKYK